MPLEISERMAQGGNGKAVSSRDLDGKPIVEPQIDWRKADVSVGPYP